jgi:hypothetical protein
MRESIEKHSFSITIISAVSAVLFVIGATYSIAEVKADFEMKTSECKTGIAHIVEELGKQDARLTIAEDLTVEIRLKLASIETSLIEIKNYFKIQ